MARKPSLPTPKFGATVTNLIASEDNPTRTGYFVRSGYRSGRMNNGPWWEITDCRGKFWQVDPEPGRFTHILGDKPHLVVDRSTELPIPGAPTEPADARPGTCPTCDSSQPHLHPSPDLCTNPWHQPVPTTVAGWRREVSRWVYLLRNLAELADLVADAGPSAGRIADDMTRALAEPADDTQETT